MLDNPDDVWKIMITTVIIGVAILLVFYVL